MKLVVIFATLVAVVMAGPGGIEPIPGPSQGGSQGTGVGTVMGEIVDQESLPPGVVIVGDSDDSASDEKDESKDESQLIAILGPDMPQQSQGVGDQQSAEMVGTGGASETRSFSMGGMGGNGMGYPGPGGYNPSFQPRPRLPQCGAMQQDQKWCYRRCEHVGWSFSGCQQRPCLFRPQTGKSSCGMEVQIFQHYANVKAFPVRYCAHPNRPCSNAQACGGHTCKKFGRNPLGYCPQARCKQVYGKTWAVMWARPKCGGGRYRRMNVTIDIPVYCACKTVRQRACSCPMTGGAGGGGFLGILGGMFQSPINPGYGNTNYGNPNYGNSYGSNYGPDYGNNYYGSNYGNNYNNYGNYGGNLGQHGIC